MENPDKQDYIIAKEKSQTKTKFADYSPNKKAIIRIAKQICKDSQEITGDSCIKDNDGKVGAWKGHHENFLKIKFPWFTHKLPIAELTEGITPLIS